MSIVFPGGVACWDVRRERWVDLPASLDAWRDAAPNVDEWAVFWRAAPGERVEIDHRDLAFDGEPPQAPDWSYRRRRWLAERGPGAPAACDVDPTYVVQRLDGGWALVDAILTRVVMYVPEA